jgi:hypothetical protein
VNKLVISGNTLSKQKKIMSYFKSLIEEAKINFPREIERIEWNGTLFHMGGGSWNFNSSADWSIVNHDTMIIGCHDDKVQDFLNQYLLGKQIIQLTHSLDLPIYDPIFVLENGMKLKFFSTSYFEPWTIQFDIKFMFVASPGDKKWILE